jgi:hypothetical protein
MRVGAAASMQLRLEAQFTGAPKGPKDSHDSRGKAMAIEAIGTARGSRGSHGSGIPAVGFLFCKIPRQEFHCRGYQLKYSCRLN